MNRFLLLTSTIIVLMFWTNTSVAQLDQPSSNTKLLKGSIGTVNTDAIETEKPISLEFNTGYNGFKTAKKQLDKEEKAKQQQEDFENKGIITPQMIADQAFKKNIEGFYANFPQIDMDLGSFHTKSKQMYLASYDYGRFDGDKVQITINGKRIHNNYLLTPRMQVLKIPLDVGINKIEVTALNEGDLIPNTGYFRFIDQKNTIKEGQWMLATGAKVIAIVVRDED